MSKKRKSAARAMLKKFKSDTAKHSKAVADQVPEEVVDARESLAKKRMELIDALVKDEVVANRDEAIQVVDSNAIQGEPKDIDLNKFREKRMSVLLGKRAKDKKARARMRAAQQKFSKLKPGEKGEVQFVSQLTDVLGKVPKGALAVTQPKTRPPLKAKPRMVIPEIAMEGGSLATGKASSQIPVIETTLRHETGHLLRNLQDKKELHPSRLSSKYDPSEGPRKPKKTYHDDPAERGQILFVPFKTRASLMMGTVPTNEKEAAPYFKKLKEKIFDKFGSVEKFTESIIRTELGSDSYDELKKTQPKVIEAYENDVILLLNNDKSAGGKDALEDFLSVVKAKTEKKSRMA